MKRTYKVGKTRQGRPKVTLYESGSVLIARIATTTAAAEACGRAWANTAPKENTP